MKPLYNFVFLIFTSICFSSANAQIEPIDVSQESPVVLTSKSTTIEEYEAPEDRARRLEKEAAIQEQKALEAKISLTRDQNALIEGTTIIGDDEGPKNIGNSTEGWLDFSEQLKQNKNRKRLVGVDESTLRFPVQDEDSVQQLKCKPHQKPALRPVKVLFFVDTSGSNSSTDPGFNYRYNMMSTLLNKNIDKTNISWNLSVFGDRYISITQPKLSPIIIGGKQQKYLFDTGYAFKSSLDALTQSYYSLSAAAGGGTDFQSNLLAIQNILFYEQKRDLSDSSYNSETAYFVLFMSDGLGDCSGSCLNLIKQIKNLKTFNGRSSVQFNTIYYGPNNGDQSVLKLMADVGEGFLIDANVHHNVDLNDVVGVDQFGCVKK